MVAAVVRANEEGTEVACISRRFELEWFVRTEGWGGKRLTGGMGAGRVATEGGREGIDVCMVG